MKPLGDKPLTYSARMSKSVAIIATLGMLAGCASPATQTGLNTAVRDCQLGYVDACNMVPAWQAQADAETATNGGLAAALILLPLAILAGAPTGGGGGFHPHHEARAWHR